MHGTDALPLPPRPEVAQYRKLAKELTAAVKADDADAITAWAKRWFENLSRLAGADAARLPEWIEDRARRFTEYWTHRWTPKEVPPPQPTLAHAQFIIAR